MMSFHNSTKVGARLAKMQCHSEPFTSFRTGFANETSTVILSRAKDLEVVHRRAYSFDRTSGRSKFEFLRTGSKLCERLLRMTGKNRFSGWILAGTVLIVCLVLLGGCLGKGTQKPTEFYLLQPFNSSIEEKGAMAGEGIVLGIGPVRVRDYLNRPQIVTRTSTNEIKIHDFHYWGEPLSTNFTAILAQNLSVLLCTDRILIFPYRSKQELPIDYQVVVDVIRFDGEPGVEATLLAQYYILEFKETEKKQIVTRQPSFSKPLADKSFETLVAAMSELVADLSRDIAEEIKAASTR